MQNEDSFEGHNEPDAPSKPVNRELRDLSEGLHNMRDLLKRSDPLETFRKSVREVTARDHMRGLSATLDTWDSALESANRVLKQYDMRDFFKVSDYLETFQKNVHGVIPRDLTGGLSATLDTWNSALNTANRVLKQHDMRDFFKASDHLETFQKSVHGVIPHDHMRGLSATLDTWNSALNTANRVLKQHDMWDFLKSRLDDLEHVSSESNSFTAQQIKLEDTLRSILGRTFGAESDLKNTLSSLSSKINTISDEITPNSWTITKDARIVSGGGSISIAEAAAQIDELISRSEVLSRVLTKQQTLSDTVESIYNEIQKQNSPLRLILLQILLPIFLSVLGIVLTSYLEDPAKRQPTKREVIKQVQSEAAAQGLEQQHLSGLRLVTASSLWVRERDSRSSLPIGKLYRGQLVKLLIKGRDWSLVEFSRDGVAVQGWVFRRYLVRIDD